MSRKKILICVLIVILVTGLVFLFGGDGADQALVQQLTSKQEASESSSSSDRSPPGPVGQLRWLTSETFVTKRPARNVWTVESPKTAGVNTCVELPFDPTPVAGQKSADPLVGHPTTAVNPGFMGADACAECHQETHSGFVETAHHLTSAPLSSKNLHGSFTAPGNVLQTSDPSLSFTMNRTGKHVGQEVTLADWSLSVPVNVVVGTAKVGQSFLYWHNDALYQAHVSYLTKTDNWIPSPGFADTTANYTRPIVAGCLECHITYIERVMRPNHYDPDSAIWGISCERCHGPGRQHVDFHREHPNAVQPKYIIQPRDLSRKHQLDICGQCHSGGFTLRQKAFSFQPGDDLEQFHRPVRPVRPASDGAGGIHTANQLTRLQMSRCFQQSEMTCTTCHDLHQNQTGDVAVFTQSCLDCHQSNHCGMAEKLGQRVSDNCIGCHMPITQNESMSDVPGAELHMLMLDHYIRVDQAATQSFLSQ